MEERVHLYRSIVRKTRSFLMVDLTCLKLNIWAVLSLKYFIFLFVSFLTGRRIKRKKPTDGPVHKKAVQTHHGVECEFTHYWFSDCFKYHICVLWDVQINHFLVQTWILLFA